MSLSHLHPMIVHFPVALIIAGFIFETAGLIYRKEDCFSKTGFYLMILGTLGAIAAYITGEFFTVEVTGKAGDVREIHEMFSKLTVFIMIIASIIRIYGEIKKPGNRTLGIIVYSLFALACITVGLTGFYGGKLVYDIWLAKV